jgi:hypothetical protein
MYRMHAILLGSALCAGAGQFALADQPPAATAQQALWQPLDLEDAGSAVQQVQFSDYADDGRWSRIGPTSPRPVRPWDAA